MDKGVSKEQCTLAATVLCTGCAACAMACPFGAIAMKPDDEGFLRPVVDAPKCIRCGVCSRVCPICRQHEAIEVHSPEAYAARAIDYEIRRTSSSGGIFFLLGEQIIRSGGVVFGCVVSEPDFVAKHVCARTIEELCLMKGSKYVQSDIGDCFRQARLMLATGKKVLFSGTPCQIMGLKSYLGDNAKGTLITVTFICHGVPSPAVYHKYLDEVMTENRRRICFVRFRDKTISWQRFSLAIGMEEGVSVVRDNEHDPFLRSFLANLCLRPSCHHCLCQNGRCGADITLADFWAASRFVPQLDDNMGTSYVLVHTRTGEQLLTSCADRIKLLPVPFQETIQYNRAYFESPSEPAGRTMFMRLFRHKRLQRLGDYLIEGAWYQRYPRRCYHYVRMQVGRVLRKIGVRR